MQSMTGFGRSENSTDNYKIEIEIKSVNHRYLDLNIRLPRALNFLELTIRNQMKQFAKRGKIDVYIMLENFESKSDTIIYHPDIAKAYLNGIRKIADDFSLDNSVNALYLSRFPEVFTNQEQQLNEDELSELILTTLNEAAETFIKSRSVEGDKLKQNIIEKLEHINNLVDKISERAPEILTEYREKIYNKVEEFLGEMRVDEAVLATEMVVYADKVCVDEEMVRLKTHIAHMKDTLESGESVGRKMDFITQEMNREANTILSKSNDVTISEIGIELKTEIEKIREQIQNIE